MGSMTKLCDREELKKEQRRVARHYLSKRRMKKFKEKGHMRRKKNESRED
jgi:hypothetical protein